MYTLQGDFFHWYPPKNLKYGKPKLGESTLTQIVPDTREQSPQITPIHLKYLIWPPNSYDSSDGPHIYN